MRPVLGVAWLAAGAAQDSVACLLKRRRNAHIHAGLAVGTWAMRSCKSSMLCPVGESQSAMCSRQTTSAAHTSVSGILRCQERAQQDGVRCESRAGTETGGCGH